MCYDSDGHQNNLIEMPGKKKEEYKELNPMAGDVRWSDVRFARQILNEIHQTCNECDAEVSVDKFTPDLMMMSRRFRSNE